MTNYEKKRKRQNGRQVSKETEHQKAYRKGLFDGQSEVIDKLIESGVLPPVIFMKTITIDEFKKDYATNE